MTNNVELLNEGALAWTSIISDRPEVARPRIVMVPITGSDPCQAFRLRAACLWAAEFGEVYVASLRCMLTSSGLDQQYG